MLSKSILITTQRTKKSIYYLSLTSSGGQRSEAHVDKMEASRTFMYTPMKKSRSKIMALIMMFNWKKYMENFNLGPILMTISLCHAPNRQYQLLHPHTFLSTDAPVDENKNHVFYYHLTKKCSQVLLFNHSKRNKMKKFE